MRKLEFLARLSEGLSGLPKNDIEERLTFYSEMIDDRMEDGLTEEAAVCEIGNVDNVVSQIISDTPLAKLVKEKVTPRRVLRVWEILLLILGSPIWVSLLIAAFVIFLAVYIVVWSLIVSLWAIEASLAACSLGGVATAAVFAFQGNAPTGIAVLGAGIFCAGLSVFLFFGCKEATRGILLLTKKIALGIKCMFIGKEDIK